MNVHHPHVITHALIIMVIISVLVKMDMYRETADIVMVNAYALLDLHTCLLADIRIYIDT